MAQVRFLVVDANGIQTDHDPVTADLTLNSVKTGTGAAAAAGGISLSGGLNMNTTKITNLDTPVNATDGANKGYVDNRVTGLDVKPSCIYATLSNIASILTANAATVEATLDPVGAAAPTLAAGDRILVKAQTAAAENGIYEWSGTALARSEDCDQNAEVTSGMFTFVEMGDTLGDTGWVLSTDGSIIVGTTALTFVQFSSAGVVVGGGGFVTRIGNVVEFTELTDQNIVVGNGTNNPAKVTTVGAGTAGSAGSNQISATTTASLVIKAGVINDSQINASANIQTSKLQVDAGFTPAAASSAPVAVVGNDLVDSAFQKLQQHLNALANTTSGVGASLVSMQNLGIPSLTAATVQAAISELKGEDLVAGAGGVTMGDVLYVSANGTVSTYATITSLEFPVGLAASTATAGNPVKLLSSTVIKGLAGLTFGARYYWDGSALTSTIPTSAGTYVWQIGKALSATALLIDIDLVKRNTP